jgi:tetratricopeptide (TPR) repeat protein
MWQSIIPTCRLILLLSCLVVASTTNFTAVAQDTQKEGQPTKRSNVARRPLPKPAGGSRGFEKYAGRDASARLIAAAATRGEPADAREYREQGEAHYKAGRHDEAIKAFTESLKLKPEQPMIHFNLGVIYGELSRYDEAIKAYQDAVRIKADYPLAYFNMGNAYLDKGDYEKAVEAYQQASQLESIKPMAYYNMGVAYVELGRQDEAIRAFKEATSLSPEYAAAYYNLGITYGTAGQHKEAVEALKQALRLTEKSADAQFTPDEAHFNLGLVLLKLGMKREATEQYQILKSINSELANELHNLIDQGT